MEPCIKLTIIVLITIVRIQFTPICTHNYLQNSLGKKDKKLLVPEEVHENAFEFRGG